MQQLGCEARIDSRSYKNQGRKNEIPSIHIGPAGRYIKRESDRQQINEEIKKYNQIAIGLQRDIDRISEEMERLSRQAEESLEQIQSELAQKKSEQEAINRQLRILNTKITTLQETIRKIERQKQYTVEANKESSEKIRSMESKLNHYTIFDRAEKFAAKKQIQMEKKRIQDRNIYMQAMLEQHGMREIRELQQIINRCSEADAEYRKMTDQALTCAEEIGEIMKEYAQCMTWIVHSSLPEKHRESGKRRIK